MMEFPSSPTKTSLSRSKLRAVLLGAVAVAAVGGGLAASVSLAPRAAFAQTNTLPAAGPASFADVVDHVKGAVVSVKVKMVETAADSASDDDQQGNGPHFAPGDPMERFFKQFGNNPNSPFQHQQRPRTGQALGSGFIISGDGYVVTNNHVVEHSTDVTVTLDDGSTHSATVVGTDKKTDLALLKIKDGGDYPHVEFSGQVPRVGDWVLAVGNPFGLGGTVTAGIVSARGRDIGAGPYDDFLQIDAPVNRGNSGGPTFNANGQVVGVNTAIYSPSGGSVGIGFAIPAEVVRNVVASLRTKGSVDRGWIGVQIQPVTPEIADSLGLKDTHGALVADTQAKSPAGAAGIHSGDVITAVNGEQIDGPRDLARRIAGLGPDKTAKLTYVHDGSSKQVDVKLGSLPVDQAEAKADAGKEGSGPTSMAQFGLSLAPAASVAGAGQTGVVVAEVDPDGVGAQKGLRAGDIILDAGGKVVSRPADVSAAIASAKKEGRKAVLLRVKTGDATRYVALATTPAG